MFNLMENDFENGFDYGPNDYEAPSFDALVSYRRFFMKN